MNPLTDLHGTLATLIFAGLIFAEESGVPLPLVPGDVLLLSGGVLIASSAVSPWAFIPIVILAAIAGGFVGYTWSRTLGRSGLFKLASRLHLRPRFERMEQRLQNTSTAHIAFLRLLVPGMRVNTTLLAGAMGVPRRRFLLALVPCVVVWVVAVTALGILAGAPLERVLARVDHTLVQGAELLIVGIVGYLAARHAPSRTTGVDAVLAGPPRERLAMAIGIDVAIIATMVVGIDLIGRGLLNVGGIDDLVDGSITTGTTVVAYFFATRGGFGVTAGEALFQARYRHRDRLRRRRPTKPDPPT